MDPPTSSTSDITVSSSSLTPPSTIPPSAPTTSDGHIKEPLYSLIAEEIRHLSSLGSLPRLPHESHIYSGTHPGREGPLIIFCVAVVIAAAASCRAEAMVGALTIMFFDPKAQQTLPSAELGPPWCSPTWPGTP